MDGDDDLRLTGSPGKRLRASDPLTEHDAADRKAKPVANTDLIAKTRTMTGMEREARRALAADGDSQDRIALRAALLPLLVAELLDIDYDSDGPYEGQ